MAVKFHNFYSTTGKTWNSLPRKFFPSNQFRVELFIEKFDLTKFLWQNRGSKIATMHVYTAHSVEILIFLSHSIFSKNCKKFRENNVLRALYSKNGFRNGLISHIWRKFAQVWPIWCYRGRFGLTKSIETSVIHGTLEKLLASKLCEIQT